MYFLQISQKIILFILERNSTHQTIIIIRAGIEMFPTIIRAERFAQTCVFFATHRTYCRVFGCDYR